MRTAVIMGALSICESINPGQSVSLCYGLILASVVCFSMTTDVIEFIERKK
jgi:hypothetical protein